MCVSIDSHMISEVPTCKALTTGTNVSALLNFLMIKITKSMSSTKITLFIQLSKYHIKSCRSMTDFWPYCIFYISYSLHRLMLSVISFHNQFVSSSTSHLCPSVDTDKKDK